MNAKSTLHFAALLLMSTVQVGAWAQTASTGAAHPSGAGVRGDGAWFSYRDTYQSMIRFEKYGKPKQFIENHLQVVPKETGATNGAHDELHLAIESNAIHLNLPLDTMGRAVFPLLKAAYDDNAELIVNRPAGSVTLAPSVSITLRTDGIYEAADLRAACGQVLQYLEYANYGTASNKHCVGVQFIYAQDNQTVSVTFKNAEQKQMPLPWSDGKPFAVDGKGNSSTIYRLATYRFANLPDKGQVITVSAPLALTALLE